MKQVGRGDSGKRGFRTWHSVSHVVNVYNVDRGKQTCLGLFGPLDVR